MPEIGLRNFGDIIPGADLTERAPAGAAPASVSARIGQPAPDPAPAPLPAAPHPHGGADALGFERPLGLLAELLAHKRSQTPLAIGLFGPPGSGKSYALNQLADRIEALSAAARKLADSPFLGKIALSRIDAGDIEGHPAAALAGALHASLASAYPALAAEAALSARDPRLIAREAFERLDAARQKLEAEKLALEDADSRRARLLEALLYEATGSQIDAYAASKRARIKHSLAGFGIVKDPMLGYKDMVRQVAEDGGAGARAGFALRAFCALKGRLKLIIIACLLVLAGLGLGVAVAEQASWLALLRSNETLVGAANWIQNHMDWLLTLRQAAFAGAALALAANIWRAILLIQLVFRGADLLQAEVSARRRESGGHLAHRARRVEALRADVEVLAKRAAEAERRAGGRDAATAILPDPQPFASDPSKLEAQRFIAAVGALILSKDGGASANGAVLDKPKRIIVALDNLDAAAAPRALEILAQARSLFGRGFATLIAVDPIRLAKSGGGDEKSLDWVQFPLQLEEIAVRADLAGLVREALGTMENASSPPPQDAAWSALDEPLTEAETKLLEVLAPLAARSPRSVKRFVNLYRMLRSEAQERQEPQERQGHRGALALMLALDAGGTEREIAAIRDALAEGGKDIYCDSHKAGARLSEALAAAQRELGKISVDAARRAAATARLFSFRGEGGQR